MPFRDPLLLYQPPSEGNLCRKSNLTQRSSCKECGHLVHLCGLSDLLRCVRSSDQEAEEGSTLSASSQRRIVGRRTSHATTRDFVCFDHANPYTLSYSKILRKIKVLSDKLYHQDNQAHSWAYLASSICPIPTRGSQICNILLLCHEFPVLSIRKRTETRGMVETLFGWSLISRRFLVGL